MLDWIQELGIQPCNTRQLLSVQPVVLRIALKDHPPLARIGHDHVMTQCLQKLGHPGRVPSNLEGDACASRALEARTQLLWGRRDPALLDDLPGRVEDADMALR